MNEDRPSLLLVVNYPANTGYAWDNIERFFARVADRLSSKGICTFVAYPVLREPPRLLADSPAHPVELDATLGSWRSVWTTLSFVRREGVRILYLTDRPTRHWSYLLLKGILGCRVVVHDRTSGARQRPLGLRRAIKSLLNRTGTLATKVVAVSDYVRGRLLDVSLIPPDRTITIHNGFDPPGRAGPNVGPGTHATFELEPGRPIVACACRASPEKGVAHLLRAFELLCAEWYGPTLPALIYLGDGPHANDLRQLRGTLRSADAIYFGGYRPGAVGLLSDASVFVVPSVWQDAFPSSVLEPMAWGKAVIASRVGGIPEMIEDGVSGILVPPADESALADALRGILNDPELGRRLGEEARHTVARRFRAETQVDRTVELLLGFLGSDEE